MQKLDFVGEGDAMVIAVATGKGKVTVLTVLLRQKMSANRGSMHTKIQYGRQCYIMYASLTLCVHKYIVILMSSQYDLS